MSSARKWIRDIFGFSGNEINGFLVLIPMTVLAVISAPVYRAWITSGNDDGGADQRKLDSLVGAWSRPAPVMAVRGDSLFAFDPNKEPEAVLELLGFSSHLAKRIVAYREKGGKFRTKGDLLKIYGIDSALYLRLFRFISLPADVRRSAAPQFKARGKGVAAQGRAKFDLNTADTVILKRIYGIGSRLSARIVRFREGLGGFLSKDQLFEVYGLDSAVATRLMEECFIDNSFIPVKININTADERQLSAHPYIGPRNARALLTYRFQHGDFKDVKDIKSLPVIAPAESERFLPYLTVDQ